MQLFQNQLSLLLRDNFANQSHGIGLLFCWKGNLSIGSKNAYIFNLGGPSYLTGSDLGFVGASCMLKLYSNIVQYMKSILPGFDSMR